MNVRFISKEDMPQVERMYKDFEMVKMDKPRIMEVLVQSIEDKATVGCFIGKRLVGGVVGKVFKCSFTKDVILFVTFFYFEERKYTVPFLKKIGEAIRTEGINKIVFSAPNLTDFKKLKRFYKMMGFEELETLYAKVV